MSIEVNFRSDMLADAGVSAVLSAVFPHHLPQSAEMPCLTYSFNDGFEKLVHGGRHALKVYTVTLKVFATTYPECRNIRAAVLAYANGLNKTVGADTVSSCVVQNTFSDYEDTLELYTSTIDLVMHVKEA